MLHDGAVSQCDLYLTGQNIKNTLFFTAQKAKLLKDKSVKTTASHVQGKILLPRGERFSSILLRVITKNIFILCKWLKMPKPVGLV